FAKPAYHRLMEAFAAVVPDSRWAPVATFTYWFAMAAIVLPSLVALLRNLDALCMIVADYLRKQSDVRTRLYPAYLSLLRMVVFGSVAAWLAALIPWNILGVETIWILGIATAATARFAWRWLVR